MSPTFEPTTIAGQRCRLRHIGPRDAVFATSPATDRTVLGRTDMVARPLPVSDVPGSPDFVSGSYTLRLDDAGEASLLFPNAVASDGIPWRSRFSADGHLQWLEIHLDGELDFVGVIDQVQTNDQQVQVHCSDGWWLLKKAYQRDWVTIRSPRDVIERATQLWVPVVADNFPGSTLNPQWTASTLGVGTVSMVAGGGVALTAPTSGGSSYGQIETGFISTPATSWRASFDASHWSFSNPGSGIVFFITENNTDSYELTLTNGKALLAINGVTYCTIPVPTTPSLSLLIESDGEWVWGYINGALIGCFRRAHATVSNIQVEIQAYATAGNAAAVTVAGCYVTGLQPALM